MHSKDLIELARDPNLISGIYNYCDRWCERCSFSSRCLVYRTEKEDEDPDPSSRDITNAAFWNKLTSIFRQTGEMIRAWAEETGVDLSSEALASAAEQRQTDLKEAKDHPLAKAAETYVEAVNSWFEQTALEPETITDSNRDIEEEETEAANSDEMDATEVIRWYQFFIAAKIMRGLMSRADEEEELHDDPQADIYPRDSDGSIKVALIAIDRSVSAWRMMAEARDDRHESIRALLFQLERLRLSTESEFPSARDFVRPGFDEAALDLVN